MKSIVKIKRTSGYFLVCKRSIPEDVYIAFRGIVIDSSKFMSIPNEERVLFVYSKGDSDWCHSSIEYARKEWIYYTGTDVRVIDDFKAWDKMLRAGKIKWQEHTLMVI